MTLGEIINQRAYAGSQLVALRERLPDLEKLARKTPPRTLVAEKARVEAAKLALPAARLELETLEKNYGMLRLIEECAWRRLGLRKELERSIGKRVVVNTYGHSMFDGWKAELVELREDQHGEFVMLRFYDDPRLVRFGLESIAEVLK